MSNKQVEVNIAGQPYRFAIAPENEAALLEAIALVDTQMNKLRNGLAAKGVERVAVMAAISIASDLLALQRKQQAEGTIPVEAIHARIRELNERADEALRQYAHVGTGTRAERAG
ncbi:cell division protein ZapA [Cupriavidus sp. TA19]|uniref:cell division protein ZapA n=1 Tax=unclassified Cupriavidus TaxID=2640874 RepID=UPI000E2ED626|nr:MULTISPECIES: cell division protein ZapA [unclassified Cupriavidus]BDB25256.1 cell division protein ZapA [Cupriavidus sp. P-10]GLC94709.1 cell division protein ZapA [Cupriavidus sp. TA19]